MKESFISIHISFNSRPHEEVDAEEGASALAQFAFQFTTSRGGRRGKHWMTKLLSSFNSRPHEEVDIDWREEGEQ